MEVVPEEVGRLSRRWDEQHLDLAAAADQVAGAPLAGFAPGVRGAARRFTEAWEQHCDALGRDAEARADGLRVVIAEVVAADGDARGDVEALRPFVEEVR